MAIADSVINSREELEVWLTDKPVEWAHVIATRAALRVFPFVIHDRETLILYTFRSCFIPWAACKYPKHDMRAVAHDAAAHSAAAGRAAIDSRVANVAFAASFAADSIAARFAANLHDISAAAFISNTTINSMLWSAIKVDATYLVQFGKTRNLIHESLWLEHVNGKYRHKEAPGWALDKLEKLNKRINTDLKYGFLILNWYRSLLLPNKSQEPYSFFGEKADLTISMKPNMFWKRVEFDEGISAVLVDIDRIVQGNFDESSLAKDSNEKKASKKPVQPTDRSDVNQNSDEPTAEDELGRRPFAESLVGKINEVRDAGQRDGFAVHLHAPWGAGKTSILLMMQDYMKRSAKKETRDNNWVVVNFNAWEHERRNPPWWPLIEAVERDCSAYLAEQAGIRSDGNFLQVKLDFFKSLVASLFKFKNFRKLFRWKQQKDRWYWWRAKSDWLPYLGALIMFLLLVCLIIFDSEQSGFISTTSKIFTGLSAAVLTFIATTQSMVFGSKENANYYFQLSNDPLGRISKLFDKLIDGVDRPVCIYIDDLDRCHADFVVDLLEGIQSAFRHEKVTYVVAADKGWIRSSFETRYETFKTHVGDDAQPIGYLFLEKIFQMSTPIPGMAAYVKEEYFNSLLGVKKTEAKVLDTADVYHEKIESAKRSIEEAYPQGITPENVRQYISKDPTPENLAAAVKLVDRSAEAETEAKHLLSQFAPVLTGNPREMKRLLNAFAMRRALWILQVSTVSMEELFRWTILEQSYPALADLLSDRPELIKHFETRPIKKDDNDKKTPTDLEPFYEIDAIFEIVNGLGKTTLTEGIIHDITKGFGNYS